VSAPKRRCPGGRDGRADFSARKKSIINGESCLKEFVQVGVKKGQKFPLEKIYHKLRVLPERICTGWWEERADFSARKNLS